MNKTSYISINEVKNPSLGRQYDLINPEELDELGYLDGSSSLSKDTTNIIEELSVRNLAKSQVLNYAAKYELGYEIGSSMIQKGGPTYYIK